MKTSAPAKNPVARALWFIESHLGDAIGLDDVADVAGLSRHHLVRAFGAATGRSVMRYLRGRRLSLAARSLAEGAPDILGVALSAGYASHEAFTRAFRDQFGQTPEMVRASADLCALALVEPIRMDETHGPALDAPRIEQGRTLLVAGLAERCDMAGAAGIPALWSRFLEHFGHIPGQVGDKAYGVIWNGDDEGNMEYMAGAEVADFSDLPAEFTRLRIPAQIYAVFAHRGHITGIRATWMAIWGQALPAAGLTVADAPAFELYGREFDPRTGFGGFEIWVPVKA